MQQFSLLQGPYPALSLGEPAWGIPHLFPSGWVRMNQGTGPWPWSYGILGWRSSFGYELGTTKAFAEPESAVQRLGLGLQPVERTGVLTFEPRSFNLAWIKKGNPWSLTFEAQTGVQVTQAGGGVTFQVTSALGDIPWTLNSLGLANLNP